MQFTYSVDKEKILENSAKFNKLVMNIKVLLQLKDSSKYLTWSKASASSQKLFLQQKPTFGMNNILQLYTIMQ